jgi:DNA-binding SARP family transcriptional activator/tetratricopeptide (TPR) repeat protein/TolB-like protein
VLLSGPDGPVEGGAVQQRRLALLALLGSSGDRGRSRDQLISILWPETDAREARQHLSHSLYVLRKSLGDDSIHTASEYVRIERSLIEVDVLTFEDALARGDLETAVGAYTGRFLDGFLISDASEFERWVDDEDRRLASSFSRCVEDLACLAERAGDPASAGKWWGRLVAHDPYNSAAVVRLMEALASAGDPANAVQYAQDHIRLLEEQFEMEPPEEVLAKIEELRVGTRARGSASPARLNGAAAPGSATTAGEMQAIPGTPSRAVPVVRPVPRRAAALILAVVAGAALVWSAVTRGESDVDFLPNAILVRGVENLTGDPNRDVLARYAAYVLEGGLTAIDTLRVVTSNEAQQLQIAIQRVDQLAGANLTRQMARQVKAGLALESSFLEQDDSLRLEARLIDAAQGEVVDAARVTGADPASAIEALRDQVLVLVASRLNLGEEYLGSYARGQSYAAWQEVDTARRMVLETGREREALALLYRALAIDSTFDAAVGLAMIWHLNFGEYSRADSMASVLDGRIASIPARQRWQLAVSRAVLRRDRIAMWQAFRDWKDRLPNAGRWLHLAMAALVSQRPAACLDALDHVDLEGSRYAASGWLWYLRASCHHALESYGESLEQARLGRQRFPDDGDLVLGEVRALAALGRVEEARRLIAENLSAPAAAETFQHEQRFALLVDAGLEMKAHGHSEAADEFLARSVEWYRRRSVDATGSGPDRWRLARTLYASGRWAEAREEFSALSPTELVGDARLTHHNIDVSLLGYQGTLAVRLGDDETAARIDEQLARLRRPYLWGHAEYWRAAIAAARGDRKEAVELLANAMTHGLFAEPWGAEYPKWDFTVDPDFASLHDYPPFQELVSPRD